MVGLPYYSPDVFICCWYNSLHQMFESRLVSIACDLASFSSDVHMNIFLHPLHLALSVHDEQSDAQYLDNPGQVCPQFKILS